VPVFGERGGLLEHIVFDTFFNLPLSLKRRFKSQPISTAACVLAMLALLVYPVLVILTLAQAGWIHLRG
jgi:hypothetical protein